MSGETDNRDNVKRPVLELSNSFQSRANWAFEGVFAAILVSFDAFFLCAEVLVKQFFYEYCIFVVKTMKRLKLRILNLNSNVKRRQSL